MRPDHFLTHTALSRRSALGLAGAAALGAAGLARATPAAAHGSSGTGGGEQYDDVMFDVAAAEAGGWAPSRYGPDDQRGTFNEVTAAKTAAALQLLSDGHPVTTYNLGELMTNGFPAFQTEPPRVYEQRLTVTGYQPPAGFTEGGGILQTTTPLGANRVSIHEERFPQGYTYQIVTQLDGLNHIGVGATFYNGFQGPDIATPTGTSRLGNEHMGPIVTRGVLLDVLGLKLERGASEALSTNAAGGPVLLDDYRITIADLQAAARRGGIDAIHPGDVVLIRTGWNTIARSEPERYLAREPGIYLAEARYLADRRPAIIGSDTWGLEVLGNPVVQAVFPVHQELLVKNGIRIGEGVITDGLAEDGVYEFVYVTTPQYAQGATAGNAPPAALGQPGRHRSWG
ncbi:cyclase family protein [Geodermatophilus sp. DSM 44513]|uniref:cyclase family protein n=1 Tax=Geodermatophilus sp. DSM 44513 TaxID=1528104 RepID=UPI001281BF03|nr:cyclase family protein [Geodermatophilus sp. DSM 44513]WNV76922.1 cyclase family protein [Geodermatophilus sp. DSM 44513]